MRDIISGRNPFAKFGGEVLGGLFAGVAAAVIKNFAKNGVKTTVNAGFRINSQPACRNGDRSTC
ncbi:hypothetical protein UA45_22705, partial [Morganella morganii]